MYFRASGPELPKRSPLPESWSEIPAVLEPRSPKIGFGALMPIDTKTKTIPMCMVRCMSTT